mmetsp:Transcript_79276/g.139881  ORF Transcript_79276/g.139881 Transcript_79276/m.139881 type:complete len:199 (-) Transcript_79276:579-1175(-)
MMPHHEILLVHQNHAKAHKAVLARAVLHQNQGRPVDHRPEISPSTSNKDFLTCFPQFGARTLRPRGTDSDTSSVPSDGMTDSHHSLDEEVVPTPPLRSNLDFNDILMLGTKAVDHETSSVPSDYRTDSFNSLDEEPVPNPFAAVAQMVANLSRGEDKEDFGKASTSAAAYPLGGALGSDWREELEGPMLSWSLHAPAW